MATSLVVDRISLLLLSLFVLWFSLQFLAGWCCTSGKCPCFEAPNDKNVGKRDILWDQKHTHTAWESVGAPGSRWMSWGRAKWLQTKWSHHYSLCSAAYFCNLVTALTTDFYQVQDDLEIIWCLSVTGQEDKMPFFPLFKHPELQKRDNRIANRKFKWDRGRTGSF